MYLVANKILLYKNTHNVSVINNKTGQSPFTIIVFLILCGLFLDRAIQEGMFYDGVTYGAIARNTAMGIGSFWAPYYRDGITFSEHPPLLFWLESFAFKIFGDHYFTEKLYSFIVWVITILIFRRLWIKTINNEKASLSFALPLLIWGIMPTVVWGYPNNLLENTMCIFDLLAVLFIYNAMNGKNRFALFLLAGICVFAATLTKGPVGLFPLAVPAIHWLAFRKEGFFKMVLWNIILISVVALCYVILCQFEVAKSAMANYLEFQVLASLQGEREITGDSWGRYGILKQLGMEIIPALAIAVLLIGLSKLFKRKTEGNNPYKAHFVFFLLIGLSATLPVVASVKQRAFYIIPSFPFFALAAASLLYPYYKALVVDQKFSAFARRYLNIFCVVLAIGMLIYVSTKYNSIGRDKDIIGDMKVLNKTIPANSVIGACPYSATDFAFLAYIQRYNRLEIRTKFRHRPYAIVDTWNCGDFADSLAHWGFTKVEAETKRFVLYKNMNPNPAILPLPSSPTGGK